MFYSKRFGLLKLGLLTSIAVPFLLAGFSPRLQKANAQTSAAPAPTFTLPASLPSDAKVALYGSDSMTGVTQALSKQFGTKFPGTKIISEVRGTEPALAAVEAAQVDVAAVGRVLTAAEKTKGLNYLPLSREKIAIVVGESNPFQGDITFEQFAKIFRGEITDWSELGGSPGPIRFVDRPETSDTRQSFNSYPVFQAAPFQTGQTATQINEDSTSAMVKELGNDGIGYAIASHVLKRPGVRILSMHKTLPDDQRYPFSQSRGYAYKDASSPAVQAFLATASSPEGQQAVLSALAEEATADGGVLGSDLVASGTVAPPEAASSPAGTSGATVGQAPAVGSAPSAQAQTEAGGGVPWLPLLLGGGALAAAGGIWAATRGKGKDAATTEPGGNAGGIGQPAVGLGAIATGAGAAAGAAAAGLGAGATAARTGLAETTDLAKGAAVTAAGLGAGLVGAGAAAVGLGALGAKGQKGRAILVPRSEDTAYAYWEIPEEQKDDCRLQGGRTLGARLYDVTEGDDATAARLVHQVDCEDQDFDRHLAIPEGDRDYAVEVGYSAADSRWLPMARSSKVHVPQSSRATGMGGLGFAAAGGAAMAASATAIHAATSAHRPKTTQDSRIILVPRDSQDAYVYWEVPEDHKVELHRQGGRTPKLRLYDVTYQPNQVPNQTSTPVQEVTLTEQERDKHLPLPTSGRNYVAELGYETASGEWLKMATSTATHVPYDWAATGIGTVGEGANAAATAESKTILEVPGESTQAEDARSPAPTSSDVAPPLSSESKTILEVSSDGDTVLTEPGSGPTTGAEVVGLAGAGAAMVGLGAMATNLSTVGADEPTIAAEIREQGDSSCSVQTLTVHSRNHCYPLTPVMVQEIQDKSIKESLETGRYLIKIRSGGFGYTSGRGNYDPWVMLWIYGGWVINQQTGVSVSTTLSTLNGYDEVLTLEVLEPATLSAFFMDTHVDDNEGAVTLSIVKIDT